MESIAVYVDLTKKVTASTVGRKLLSLGFKPAGYYDLHNDVYKVKVRIPMYATEKNKQLTLFHSFNPQYVSYLINAHPVYANMVANSQEAKNLVDTIGNIDFSEGFQMSSIMGIALPLLTNKGGLKFTMDLTFMDFKTLDEFADYAVESGDESEDLRVETSILNKNLLSHPKVSKLLGGILPGVSGKKGDFF